MSMLLVRALPAVLCFLLALSMDEDEQDVLTDESLDVNLLSQALLHLGFVLKEQVAHTKEEMARVYQELELFNRSLAELVQQIGDCERARDILARRAEELGLQGGEFVWVSEEAKTYLSQMMELEAFHRAKMQSLEERLENILDLETQLMALLKSQDVRIDDLFADMETQDKEMNAQEARLENLVKEVASRKRKLGSRRQK
ncbi:hypothetical protein NDU88_002357 [Pleurodeles waltl]|uniref:Uncharacterized protein n=1 Tax=Pleurodeles waltl TaxID=8319 RepID=A0AAV7W4B4_PLEWA|nr:hypothetical protein NDU88_002357 [Pleurodeles waltl]